MPSDELVALVTGGAELRAPWLQQLAKYLDESQPRVTEPGCMTEAGWVWHGTVGGKMVTALTKIVTYPVIYSEWRPLIQLIALCEISHVLLVSSTYAELLPCSAGYAATILKLLD